MAEKFPTAQSPEKKPEEMTPAELVEKIRVLKQELQVLLATPDTDVLANLRKIEIPRKYNDIALYEMQRQKLLLSHPEEE